MKNTIFAAVLLLSALRVGQAGGVEFKSSAFANYGSPFFLVYTTPEDLVSTLNTGGLTFTDGAPDGELQDGVTSWSDAYNPGPGNVSFSASSVYHPSQPPSNPYPTIGAKASASNDFSPGAATIIGESYAYSKDTAYIANVDSFAGHFRNYSASFAVDGVAHVSGDALVELGEAVRITLPDGTTYTHASTWAFQAANSPTGYYYIGRPSNDFSDVTTPPLSVTTTGPTGIDLGIHGALMTIETLLYVRAQTGALERGGGTADADFSNTMRMSNFQFFDENGQVIPGLQIIGSDGGVYPYNVVPEPSTVALFGAGALGLLLARFRRRQRC